MSRLASARQRGQAIVEFLASALALVALLAAITIVARLHDLQWATIAASRYAAFEQAMLPESRLVALEGTTRTRLFDSRPAPLRADDSRAIGNAWRALDPNWALLTPGGAPLVALPEDVRLLTGNAAVPGVAAQLATNIAALADGAARLSGGRFDVERRGFYAAEVSVRLASLAAGPLPLPDLALTLRENTRVVGTSWDASGPAQVAARTAAFVPAAPLRALQPLVDAFDWALRLFEPAIADLCLGRIDAELVPVDRLGAPGSGERGDWRVPC